MGPNRSTRILMDLDGFTFLMFSMKVMCFYKVNNISFDEFYLNWNHRNHKMGPNKSWSVQMELDGSGRILMGPADLEIVPKLSRILGLPTNHFSQSAWFWFTKIRDKMRDWAKLSLLFHLSPRTSLILHRLPSLKAWSFSAMLIQIVSISQIWEKVFSVWTWCKLCECMS